MPRPVGLGTAVKGLTDALHLLRHPQVANPHLAQIVVHILAKPVENALPKAVQGRLLRQPVEDHS